ncbi:MAG: replicative DNA helicase [Parcubacteria group bacterium]|nr:replicative DNA helicase [Parcubacteria group bacterium]
MDERVPPQDIEAEQSVLGSLIMDKKAIAKIADFLIGGDFYKKNHALIFEAITELFSKDEPIDLLSLSSRLKEKNQLEEIGGRAYLTSLVNIVPTASHVVHYAKIVSRKRVLRDLISASQEISQLGFDENTEVDSLLDHAEEKIFKVSQRSLSQEFLPVSSALAEAFSRIDNLSKGDGILRGIPTGFDELDNILAGLQASDLVVLAARPSLGKTALALSIARHAACQKKIPVGIFSLEMSREQVVDRLLAAEAGIDLWRLRTGRLHSEGEDNDFDRLRNAMQTLHEAPIFIDDTAVLTVMQMKTMARRLQSKHGLGFLVIDYLQLMQPRIATDNIVQNITEISRSLKALARELKIPVLAISQLSRAVEQRHPPIPRLSDLRESGSIEQDADVVMFIYREDRYKENTNRKNIAEIRIEKHRNGPVGKVELYFNETLATFANLEKRFSDVS